MRLTVYNMMAFFIMFNLSLFLLNYYTLLGSEFGVSPYASPEEMQLVSTSLDTEGLTIGLTAVTVGMLFGYFAGNMIVGGSIGLLILATTILFPIVRWVLFGFPLFLSDIGVPAPISQVLIVIFSFVWFWFFISFFTERSGVSEGW